MFTEARDATANFWRMKEDNTDSQMILEREYPGMRKEIPEGETFNKYGHAARKIEVNEFAKRCAVERIRTCDIPAGAKMISGRFVYTVKEKPVEMNPK